MKNLEKTLNLMSKISITMLLGGGELFYSYSNHHNATLQVIGGSALIFSAVYQILFAATEVVAPLNNYLYHTERD
ncbi:MAG: hypothetical protein NTX24_01670 [Candidatus Pacearchaeota archaeon]|nr:hypothetical protein [Candidatus Pacearchaeota archaeon]